MFFLRGAETSLSNLLVLTAPYRPPQEPASALALQRGYRAFLGSAQNQKLEHLPVGPTYVDDLHERERISDLFGRNNSASDVQRFATGENVDPTRDKALVLNGISSLADVSPALSYLFEISVHTVISTVPPRSPGSGSLPPRMGTIYINPGSDWSVEDVRECLLHELSHMLISLDEFRYGHHPDTQEAWNLGEIVPTAVTGRPRSLNISFQSVLVGAEILCLRAHEGRSRGVHGLDREVAEAGLRASSAIRNLPNLERLATTRFLDLLTDAEAILDRAVPETSMSVQT